MTERDMPARRQGRGRPCNEARIAQVTVLASEGLTRRQIAEQTGLSYPTMTAFIMAHNIAVEREPYMVGAQLPSQRNREILAMLASGKNYTHTGIAFSITRERVRQIVARHGGPEHRHSARINHRISVICSMCSMTFTRPKSIILRSRGGVFCSRGCYSKWRRDHPMPPTERERVTFLRVKALRLMGRTWNVIITELGKSSLSFCRSYRHKTPSEDQWPVFGATADNKRSHTRYGKEIRPLNAGAMT